MALKLKQKAKVAEAEVVDVAALVDSYGDNALKIAAIAVKMKKLQDEMKPLKATEAKIGGEIEALYEDKGDDEEIVAEGTRFYVDIGKKGSKREITDIKHVKKVMGDKVFFELVKVNLGDVDKYLTKPEQEKCIKTERTERSRSVRPKK